MNYDDKLDEILNTAIWLSVNDVSRVNEAIVNAKNDIYILILKAKLEEIEILRGRLFGIDNNANTGTNQESVPF